MLLTNYICNLLFNLNEFEFIRIKYDNHEIIKFKYDIKNKT